MTSPNAPSVDLDTPPPGASRWSFLTGEDQRLTLSRDEVRDDLVRLTVGAEAAVPSAVVYLGRRELRALAAAARALSGAEAEDREGVRRDERERLARLFEENAGTLASFPRDAAAAIQLIVLLLRLNNPVESS
jgi:hypothetical protein